MRRRGFSSLVRSATILGRRRRTDGDDDDRLRPHTYICKTMRRLSGPETGDLLRLSIEHQQG